MIGLSEIRAARDRIVDAVKVTPCLPAPIFAERTGVDLWLKYENLQVTGSFKARGALNTLRSLTPAERERGVAAFSAGNHAQGVAWAATRSGAGSVIVMPETTPLIKVTRTRALGGDVVLHGESFEEARERAEEIAAAEGYTIIHAFDDERVIAGQGSIGLELVEQVEDLEAVVVPIGGGGLISGIATAVKALRPEVRIFGVQSESAPAMKQSLEAGEPVDQPTARSLAEGIGVKHPGRLTFDYVREHVERIALVSEIAIEEAIFGLLETAKTVTEGAGAAGMAAVLADRLPEIRGLRTAVVLCGGNIDLVFLHKIIERCLVRQGRLCNLHVTIQDRPGALARLLEIIAELGANVDHIDQRRIFTDSTFWEVEAEVTLETKGPEHITRLIRELESRGYRKLRNLGPSSIT